jgi:hypothetical protein
MSERFAQAMIALAVLVCIANAIFMVVAPIRWYWTVPTVPATGPANSHFITDVGLAYLCCGITLCYGALYPSGRWLALITGAMWLIGHALFNVFEFATEGSDSHSALIVVTRRIAPAGLPQRIFLRLAQHARSRPREIHSLHAGRHVPLSG